MTRTLNLKVTHETNTETPFFMVTPEAVIANDPIAFYPLFTGTMKQTARFMAQCCNATLRIDIDNLETRRKMSQMIDELRGRA